MPELPEVESIRRVLLPDIVGKRIKSVIFCAPHVCAHPSSDITLLLTGLTFSDITRRGKFMIFHFETGERLVLHLRMTGRLLVLPEEQEERHTHLRLRLSDGLVLNFIDLRKLGRVWFINKDEKDTFSGISNLGPEPFDEIITGDYLLEKLSSSRQAIKSALMEQRIIAGIGNIYSDQILFAAGILPHRRCCDITEKEYDTLARCVKSVMGFFLDKNMISHEEYYLTLGLEYKNTPYIDIYSHAGKPCPKCGTEILNKKISGRTSCFCPSCQK